MRLALILAAALGSSCTGELQTPPRGGNGVRVPFPGGGAAGAAMPGEDGEADDKDDSFGGSGGGGAAGQGGGSLEPDGAGGTGGDPGAGGAGGPAGAGGAAGTGGAGAPVVKCCGGAGTCVAPGDAQGGRPQLLGEDSCADGQKCEPDVFRDGAQPASCVVGQGALEGQIDTAGACLPDCIPLVRVIATFLRLRGIDVQGDCGVSQVCVPCTNPLDGQPTGACVP